MLTGLGRLAVVVACSALGISGCREGQSAEASARATSPKVSPTSAAPAAEIAPREAPRADALVAAAVKTAAAEGKVVLIEFGASWCVWCTRFQAFVQAPEVRQIIATNYVILNLTVQERDDKKSLENPGADALMQDWGGGKAGLPFYVFLDKTGAKMANSNAMPNGGNIGFPATTEEVAAFMALLDKTAPKLGGADRTRIAEYLAKTLAE